MEKEEEKKELNRKFFQNELKLFGKYPYSEAVKDVTLSDLMAINSAKSNIIVPHTSGRYQIKRFRKIQCPIIERLTNSLMYHGRNNGKKCLAIKIVKQAFEIISLVTNKNPLEVVLKAITVAGPREDSTRIGSAFRTSKNIAECLADELIACAAGTNSSYAIRKKDEIERAAKANR